MHYRCICAILLAMAKNTSCGSVSQPVLSEVPTSSATEKEVDCPCDPASPPSALILGKELGVCPALPLFTPRPIPPKDGIPGQASRFGSSPLKLKRIPVLYESHARVRAPAFGGTSTLSHGAAPAQECRLAVPWVPPFKSSTPESFRGSCPFAFSAPWQTETPKFPFWKEKLRSETSLFPSKTESKRFLEGRGEQRPMA
jgi:hypothetical protein